MPGGLKLGSCGWTLLALSKCFESERPVERERALEEKLLLWSDTQRWYDKPLLSFLSFTVQVLTFSVCSVNVEKREVKNSRLHFNRICFALCYKLHSWTNVYISLFICCYYFKYNPNYLISSLIFLYGLVFPTCIYSALRFRSLGSLFSWKINIQQGCTELVCIKLQPVVLKKKTLFHMIAVYQRILKN